MPSKKTGKRKRIPFGAHRTRMQVDENIPGYHLHWFNDEPGRLEQAEGAGYEYVKPNEVSGIGQGGLHKDNTDLNSKVSLVVDKKTGVRAYLMKIKDEYRRQDNMAKEEVNQRVDEAMRIGTPGGNVVENQYVPKGHVQKV